MPMPIVITIAVLVTLCIVAPITWFSAIAYRKKVYENKVGRAEEKSREIIDDALKVAETKKREALLEAKEESIKAKNDFDKEVKERRAELQRYERRVLQQRGEFGQEVRGVRKKRSRSDSKRRNSGKTEGKKQTMLLDKEKQELERISGLTSEQAKEYLLKTVEEDVKHDTAKLVKELESRAKEEANKKAKEYVVTRNSEMCC